VREDILDTGLHIIEALHPDHGMRHRRPVSALRAEGRVKRRFFGCSIDAVRQAAFHEIEIECRSTIQRRHAFSLLS